MFELVARLLHPADAAQRILVHLIPARDARVRAINERHGRASAQTSGTATPNIDDTESPLATAQATPEQSSRVSETQDSSILPGERTPGAISPNPSANHAPLKASMLVSPLSSTMPAAALPLKSLVLDLDETLVHAVYACPRGPYDLALKVREARLLLFPRSLAATLRFRILQTRAHALARCSQPHSLRCAMRKWGRAVEGAVSVRRGPMERLPLPPEFFVPTLHALRSPYTHTAAITTRFFSRR